MSKINRFINDFADSFIKLNEEFKRAEEGTIDKNVEIDPDAEPIFNEDKGR